MGGSGSSCANTFGAKRQTTTAPKCRTFAIIRASSPIRRYCPDTGQNVRAGVAPKLPIPTAVMTACSSQQNTAVSVPKTSSRSGLVRPARENMSADGVTAPAYEACGKPRQRHGVGQRLDVENGLMRARFTGSQQRTRVEPPHFAERRRWARWLLELHSLIATRICFETGVSNLIKAACRGCGFPSWSALRVISALHFIQEKVCTS